MLFNSLHFELPEEGKSHLTALLKKFKSYRAPTKPHDPYVIARYRLEWAQAPIYKRLYRRYQLHIRDLEKFFDAFIDQMSEWAGQLPHGDIAELSRILDIPESTMRTCSWISIQRTK